MGLGHLSKLEGSGGLVGTFKIDDGRKVQIAVWLAKDETSSWWEVTNGECEEEGLLFWRNRTPY